MPDTLIARPLVDLSPFLDQSAGPRAVGIGYDQAVYVARTRTSEALRTETRGASFPKSQLSIGTHYRVSRCKEGEVQTMTVGPESVVASYVQPTPRGVLLVGARCRWRAKGPETNAVEYNWEGEVLARFTLGDGINAVQTTETGAIWVSYFDEGVFGNYGWGGPGPTPIGADGLVRFDADGNQSWSYSGAEAHTDTICDAYAMNIASDDDVWVYFYTEFPVVRIHKGRYKVWTCGVRGAHALAVDKGRVLLYGGYDQRNLLQLATLGSGGRAEVEGQAVPTLESGEPIEDAYGIGIGNALYLVRPREVLVIDDW